VVDFSGFLSKLLNDFHVEKHVKSLN
jgi:hypothetical protein